MVGCNEPSPENSAPPPPSPAALPSHSVLSQDEAKAITEDVLRWENTVNAVMKAPGLLAMDEQHNIPETPDYWLITDERFPDLDSLKAFIQTAYTDNLAQTAYKGVYSKEEHPDASFREYQGACM